MNSVLIMRQYAVNVVTYKRQKSFSEKFIYVIIRKLVLRICSIVRFLTIRQYAFLDKPHMQQYAFLQCNYTLLSSSYDSAYTSTCGFRSESTNDCTIWIMECMRYCALLNVDAYTLYTLSCGTWYIAYTSLCIFSCTLIILK